MRTLTLALLAALALTGCSGAEDDTDDSSGGNYAPRSVTPYTEPYTVPSSGGDTTERAFEMALRDVGIIPMYGTLADHVDLARSTCSALDRGATDDQAVTVLIDSGYTRTLAGYFLGAATAAYCPEHV